MNYVYGGVEKVNEKELNRTVQHMGFGKRLLKEAERIAWDNGYNKMAISAIGTRNYYRKFGYELEDTYMVKNHKSSYTIRYFYNFIYVFMLVYFSKYCYKR